MKTRAACVILSLALLSCTRDGGTRSASGSGGAPAKPRVLAVETFLADITANVAGDALSVEALLPPGADPHSFEPSPRDAAVVARADLIIENGGGLEGFLQKLVENASVGKSTASRIVSASAGLPSRTAKESEAVEAGVSTEADPHYWMDPLLVMHYADTIAAALSSLDPADKTGFESRAAAYKEKLAALDAWITAYVSRLPPPRRILVTNHESLGYFADRYGFTIVGTVIPGTSSEASPSARQMAALIQRLRTTKPGAIFVEVGTNMQLVRQVARDAGVGKVLELYDHSLTPPDGPAPTYIDMMRYDVRTIVDGLMGG